MTCMEHRGEARQLMRVAHGEHGEEVRAVYACDGPPAHTWEEVHVRGRLVGRRPLSMLAPKQWPEYLSPAPGPVAVPAPAPAPGVTRSVSTPRAPAKGPVIRIVRRR